LSPTAAVAVIPARVAPEVLAFARRKASQEDGFRAAVQGGMPLFAAYKKFNVL
jgi:regulator of RNase E activity RraA